MAATACKPCQPADQSNDATTFTEPLLKNVIPFDADPPVPPATKGDHKLPIFAQRVQPEEEPAETSERDVEALRKQVREALGEAVEDGTLEELMAEAASQPFAAKAELLVVKRKTPPSLPKAKRTPQEAWHGTTALEAKSEDPLTGEARLAKMRVSVDENMAEEEAATGPPLDAISVASSQEDDLKLAKAHVNGPSTIAATPADVVVADVEEQAADEAAAAAHVNGPSTIAATPADVVVADVEEQAADEEAHVNGPSTIAATPADVVVADVEEQPPNHHEVTNEVLPEQLEKLRQKAQEALLQGAQSGELWTLLQGHASQRAAQSELLKASQSGRLHCALKQLRRVEDVEQIRQHAVDSLVTAARSGRLLQTLQLTMKCSALQEIRKESREMVTVAAETGLLQEALQDAQVAPEGDLETLRHLTKEAMMMAAESGELAHVLESATGKAPSKPILRKQDTPESSIVDLSEASDSIDQRLSIHTAMAVQMVQDEVKLAADKEAVRQSNNDIKAKAFGSVLRFFERPSSRIRVERLDASNLQPFPNSFDTNFSAMEAKEEITAADAAVPMPVADTESSSPTEVPGVRTVGGKMELTVVRLSGEETVLTVQEDCTLKDFRTALAKKGLIDDRLMTELLVDGRTLNQQSVTSTLHELGVNGSSIIMVVTKRVHDYSRITKLECQVRSEKWPQGLFTTSEGLLYVCHFDNELLVFSPELDRISKRDLPRDVVRPSQMDRAPNGDLVFACTRSGPMAAVVDPETLELKRELRPNGAATWTSGGCTKGWPCRRGLGPGWITMHAVQFSREFPEGLVYLSHIRSSVPVHSSEFCVVALDFESGEVVKTFDGFVKPSGLCVANDQLVVVDRGAHQVRVLSLDGEDLLTFGQGCLKYPNDVAVDNCGNFLVMDTGNERVAVFSPDGQLTASVLPRTFKDRGNTHSYISVNPLTGTIAVSMDDIHKVAILAPPIRS
eukprot:symbB.v1.2.016004.t3/scaffold1208.1/size131501/4